MFYILVLPIKKKVIRAASRLGTAGGEATVNKLVVNKLLNTGLSTSCGCRSQPRSPQLAAGLWLDSWSRPKFVA